MAGIDVQLLAQKQINVAAIPLEHNRRQVERYLGEKELNGCKPATLATYAKPLRTLGEFLGSRKVESLDKDLVVEFLAGIKLQPTFKARRKRNDGTFTVHTFKGRAGKVSEAWLIQHKMVLKNFMRWVRGTKDFPPEVAWLEIKNLARRQIPADSYIPNEAMLKILQAATHPRDKALFHVLYESGFRISEALSLNLGNVSFDKIGAVLTLPSKGESQKTGPRQVQCYAKDGSADTLLAWYEAHPLKGRASAPLFCSYSDRNRNGRLSRNGAYQALSRIVKASGIDLHVTNHMFRHTSATNDVKRGLPEPVLRAKHGWTATSPTPARYIHMSGKDYLEADRAIRGFGKQDVGQVGLLSQVCARCKERNAPTATYCQRCREPLTLEAREKLEATQNETIHELIAKAVLEKNADLAEIVAARVLKKLKAKA